MRRDLTASVVAVIVFTLIFGLAYTLITTGVAQLIFSDKADGSRIERDGTTVGSELIGQAFTMRVPKPGPDGPRFERVPDPRYFQSRPSATKYSADVTFFNNLGPNNAELSKFFEDQRDAYLALEGRYTPGLSAADVPVDAVTTSTGLDPQISEAKARIQAIRVAHVRGIPLDRVLDLIDENTDDRGLGILGEPGVNVLKLNLALDDEEGG